MFGSDPAAQCGRTAEFGTETGPSVGELVAVFGAVTITRANSIVGDPIGGQPVYEGDILETGDDGVVAIAFIDGTFLHLHPNGRVCLDEFNCHAENSSALIRIPKGVFGFIAGKLAAEGRLCVDTPLGQLRNRVPAFGIGSLALGVFTFALVRELKADSTDIAFLDNGTIDYKDLKHGVFEIVTKGDHPQVIIVDDPTQTIVLRPRGSGGVSIQEIANTPTEMARLGDAYSHAYSTYSEGIQDPFFQQWQHANAQPQSTGAGGSSTSLALLSLQNNPEQGSNGTGPTGINLHSNNSGNDTGTAQGTSGSSSGLSPQTPSAHWQYDSSGDWSTASDWSDGWSPLSWQDLTIGFPVIVTIDSATGDSGPTATAVTDLTVGVGATLEIIDGGLLTVSNILDVVGTVEVLDPGTPTLTLQGPVTVETSGTIEAIGSGATIYFSDATLPPPGSYTVDNNGVIAADTGATVFFEQSITKNESGAEIVSSNLGTVQFDQGGLENIGTVRAESGATLVFNDLDVENLVVGPSTLYGLIAIDAQGTLNFTGTVTIDNGTLTNAGTVNVGISSSITANVTIENENGGTTAGETGPTTVSGNGPNVFTSMPTGILYVLDGSTLTLFNDTVSGGTITVDSGGTLILDDTYMSADVHLNIEPGATLEVFDTTTIDTIQSVLLGQTTVESGTVLNYSNELILGGLAVDGPSGLLDAGTVNLEGNDTIGGNTLYNGQTYQGALVNAGVINNVSGANIIEDYDGTVTLPGGETNEFVNTGKLEIFAGSSLTLANDVVANSNSSTYGLIQIDASNGPTVAGNLDLTGTDTINNGQLINYGTFDIGNGAIANVLIENENGSAITNTFSNAGTVTVDAGATLTLLTDQVSNAGTITVDAGANPGLLALTSTTITQSAAAGSISNSGTLNLNGSDTIDNGALTNKAGGNINVSGSGNEIEDENGSAAGTNVFSNSGSVTLNSGSTLTLTDDTVDNSGGLITVDGTGTLNLTGIDTISGGTLTVESGGAVAITSGASVTFDDVAVTDDTTSLTAPGIDVASGAVLTLQDGTSISGSGTGTLAVEFGAQLFITTPSGVTLNGIIIDDDGTGSGAGAGGAGIYVSGAVLTLKGGTQIEGGAAAAGTLQIDSTGELKVTGAATLDSVTVTDGNLGGSLPGIDVSGAMLTLDDETLISGGTLTVESTSGSQLLITAGPGSASDGATAGGATLDAVSVADRSTSTATPGINVASGAVLTLDAGTAITGVSGATMTLAGTLEVDNGSDLISNVAVTDVGTAQLVVSGGTLTLTNDLFSGGVIDITVDSGASLILSDTHIADAVLITEPGSTLTVPSNSSIETINSTLSGNNTVGTGATLTLTDESVTGTIKNYGIIDVETAGNPPDGAIFEGVVVTNIIGTSPNGGIEVGETSAATLVLEDGAIISGGYLNVESGGYLSIAAPGGATLDNVLVDDDTTTFSTPGIDVASGAILILKDSTTILGGGNGTLTIETGGQLSITTASGATLDGLLVHDDNTTDGIDVASGAVLTLDDATVISGGTLTVEGTGKLLIAAGSGQDAAPNRGATIESDTLTNAGTIEVSGTLTLLSDTVDNSGGLVTIDAGGVLAMTGADTISGGTVTVSSGGQLIASGSSDTIEDSASVTIDSGGLLAVSGGTLTLTDDQVTNDQAINVISGSLTLTSGTSITNNDAITVEASGLLTLDDTSKISGGTITVDSGGTLTMAGTADLISGAILDNSGTVNANGTDTWSADTVSNSHAIDVSGSLTLNSGSSITNATTGDTITVDSNATLTLDDTSKIVGGTITVDSGGTLTMAGTADLISGAILDNSGTVNANGTDTWSADTVSNSHAIDVSGSLTLNSGSSITNATTGDTITVDSNATLTLDDTSKIVGGTITVDSGGTLTMAGTADLISGAILDNSGTVNANGTDTWSADTVSNSHAIDVSGSLTLNSGSSITNATTGDTITVDSNATLTLDDTSKIVGGTITVDSGGTLTMAGSSTGDGIDGATLDVSGTLKMTGTDAISGGTVDISSGGQLIASGGSDTIEDSASVTIASGGLLEVSGGTLTLSADTVTNDQDIKVISGSLTLNSGTSVTNNDAITVEASGLLTLDDTSKIVGGTITVDSGGTLTMAGSSTGDGIDGATLDVSGTLKMTGADTISGGTVTVSSGGKLIASGSSDTIEDSASVTIASGGLLDGLGRDADAERRHGHQRSRHQGDLRVADA